MLDWLQTFGNFIQSIVSFIIDFLRGVIEILILLGKAFGYTWTIVNYLPLMYRTPLVVLLSVSLIVTIAHFGE